MKEILLFDLDGTLIDTEQIHFQAYKQVLSSKYSTDMNWSFESYCITSHCSSTGLQHRIMHEFAQLFEDNHLTWTEFYKQKKQMHAQLLTERTVDLLPGVEQYLERQLNNTNNLRFVVTHSPRIAIQVIYEKFQLFRRAFPDEQLNWITQDDYEKAKPEPDGYLVALRRSVSDIDEDAIVVGFEDTPRGFQSLKTALYQWNRTRAKPVRSKLYFMNVHNIPYPELGEVLTSLDEYQQIIHSTTGFVDL